MSDPIHDNSKAPGYLFDIEDVEQALAGIDQETRQLVLGRLGAQGQQEELRVANEMLFYDSLEMTDFLYRKQNALHSPDGEYAYDLGYDLLQVMGEHPSLRNPIYDVAAKTTALMYIFGRSWDDEPFEASELDVPPFTYSGLTQTEALEHIQRGVRYQLENESPDIDADEIIARKFTELSGIYSFSMPLVWRESFRVYTEDLTAGFAALGVGFPLHEEDYRDYRSEINTDLAAAYPDFETYIDPELGIHLGRRIAEAQG